METKRLNVENVEKFKNWLYEQERSKNTIDKYVRDVKRFLEYAGNRNWGKDQVLQYKELLQKQYKVTSVNSMLVALNCYLRFIGKPECCVNICKVQRCCFREEKKELTFAEYKRLVETAERENKEQLSIIIQTIASTGIRVSELCYITAESLEEQVAEVCNKGKRRMILLPLSLVKTLQAYCRKVGIQHGSIFLNPHAHTLDTTINETVQAIGY